VVAHIVLFRPKPDLDESQRRELAASLQYALTNIPVIKRARVGRRLTLGRLYDRQNLESYPFVAILEFESEADLRLYLDHPAHEALGAQFYTTSAGATVYDFDLIDAARVTELLAT
jgi:hypothetical protein